MLAVQSHGAALHAGLQNRPDKGYFLGLQSGEGWNRCVLPKAMGAINLDAESRRLSTPLDVFVLFSSAIVEMGNPGTWWLCCLRIGLVGLVVLGLVKHREDDGSWVPAGQANYGYGNAVGDELCRTRLAEGVPGVSLSVQWGAVGDVGFLAQKDTVRHPLFGTTSVKKW